MTISSNPKAIHMTDDIECRAEFERWAKDCNLARISRKPNGYVSEYVSDLWDGWQAAWNRRASGWRKLDDVAKTHAEVIVGHYDADNDEWRDICIAFWHAEELEWTNWETMMGLMHKPTHYMPITPPENAK